MRAVKAGFVGFGEINTPRDVVDQLSANAVSELEKLGWEVYAPEPVSDEATYSEADRAIKDLKNKDFDLLVVCVTGWIPTHAVIRVTDKFRHIPMLLWGLTGWMEEGRLVTTAPQAGTSALRQVMQGLGYCFRYVFSKVDEPVPVKAINAFGQAARTAVELRDMRIGSMGYRDMLLYGTPADILALRREIGIEVECFEMLEMVRTPIDKKDVDEIVDYCLKNWTFEKEFDHEILAQGARYYLSLKKKIQERGFDAITLLDVDGMKKLESFPPAMVFMLIADLLKICTIPENDIIGNATQLMVKTLTGQIAHYMEFYEYFDETVLIGVPDFVPGAVVDGDIRLLPAKFGLLSASLLNTSKVKDGPVTLMRLIEDHGRYTLHMARGEAMQPRPWEEYGWDRPAPQLPSLEVKLEEPVNSFVDKIASQHTIIAYGDVTEEMTQLCKILKIRMI